MVRMMIKKLERLAEANCIIEAISRHGRRFFYSTEHQRIARFELADGKLWFRDDATWRRVYTAYRGPWRHFSHGGTLRGIVEALAHFIRTGSPISSGHFGPWPAWVCSGDLWGYGPEAMGALRAELHGSDAIKQAGKA